jgi:hypothetical protein
LLINLPIEINWDYLGHQDSIDSYEETIIDTITKDKIEALKRAKRALKRAKEDLKEAEGTEDLKKIISAQIRVDRVQREYFQALNIIVLSKKYIICMT